MYSLDTEIQDSLSLLNLRNELRDDPGKDGRSSLVLGKAAGAKARKQKG